MSLRIQREINQLIEKRNKYLDCLEWLDEVIATLQYSTHLSKNKLFKKHPFLYYLWFTVTIGIQGLTTQIEIKRSVFNVTSRKHCK